MTARAPRSQGSGIEAGTSDWLVIDQDRIDAFSRVTATNSLTQGTGRGRDAVPDLLILSMISRMADRAVPVLSRCRESVSVGLDRVRFLAPVPAGSRLRGVFTMPGGEPRAGPRRVVRLGVLVEIETDGVPCPVLEADWLVLLIDAG